MIFDYKHKENRYAVVRKLSKTARNRSNFKKVYATREEAETEAGRLAETVDAKFYIIEILAIANAKPRGLGFPTDNRQPTTDNCLCDLT